MTLDGLQPLLQKIMICQNAKTSGQFFEPLYVVTTVIVLAALKLEERLKSGGTVYGGAVSSMEGSSSKSWDEEATVVLASKRSLF